MFQCDTIEILNGKSAEVSLAAGYNMGWNKVLTCVDVFTRVVFVVPIHYNKKDDRKDEDEDAGKLSRATGAAATQLITAIFDYYNGLQRRGCDAGYREKSLRQWEAAPRGTEPERYMDEDELFAHRVLNVGSEFISELFALRQLFGPRVCLALILGLPPQFMRDLNCLLPISPIEHRRRGRNRSEHQQRHFPRRCRCHHCVLYSEQTISVTRNVS